MPDASATKPAFGLTAKYVHEGLENENADGFVVDFGTIYFTDFRTIRIGMAIQSLGPSLTFIDQSYPMPTMFKVGTAMRFLSVEPLDQTIAGYLWGTSNLSSCLSLGTPTQQNLSLVTDVILQNRR